ncbi:MAG: hypothetical protein ACI4ED_09350 [Suilimivivens sp.]
MKKKVTDADLVLVGIGEEFEIKETGTEKNKAKDAVLKRKQCYNQLKKLLESKNYFIISLCMDGIIHEAGFDEDRIVEPCGTYTKLQCSDKCTADIYEPDPILKEKIQKMIEGEYVEKELALPLCPRCGKTLAFNNILTENYAEEGYLDKWQLYKKWLQGTVNRKICVLELGVGMRFPTVIRWPFEKVIYYNQKASFFRVHSKLYQTTAKISERSVGIQSDPMDFLNELCNEE